VLHPVTRRDQPSTVVGRAEQCGEAGTRIETWKAEPVDRSVPADERDGLGVADECVVFDT
jgi:hypothetical protein